jgi:hypothetical protein
MANDEVFKGGGVDGRKTPGSKDSRSPQAKRGTSQKFEKFSKGEVRTGSDNKSDRARGVGPSGWNDGEDNPASGWPR